MRPLSSSEWVRLSRIWASLRKHPATSFWEGFWMVCVENQKLCQMVAGVQFDMEMRRAHLRDVTE